MRSLSRNKEVIDPRTREQLSQRNVGLKQSTSLPGDSELCAIRLIEVLLDVLAPVDQIMNNMRNESRLFLLTGKVAIEAGLGITASFSDSRVPYAGAGAP